MTQSITPFEFYRTIKSRLAQNGSELPDMEARILFEDIANMSPIAIRFSETPMAPHTIERILQAVDHRKTGEPLGRILGYRDFWKHRFYMSADTLEPRPDTEILIEAVLKSYKQNPATILDIGTGTGCILLSLLHEFPDARGVGIDISEDASHQAKENAELLQLADRAEFKTGSYTDPLIEGTLFDLIVSNPPYIPTGEIANLPENVRNFDPVRALDGGNDGLDAYTNLLPRLKNYLTPNGRVFFECGIGQAEQIGRLAENAGANLIRVTHDLGGVPRVVEISYGDK